MGKLIKRVYEVKKDQMKTLIKSFIIDDIKEKEFLEETYTLISEV